MDMALADRAHRLSMQGMTGPEIAKEIGVRYAADAHTLASVGWERARLKDAALTEPEIRLLRALATAHRALLGAGAIRSPKTPYIARLAGRRRGWPAATAAKRLGTHRPGEVAHFTGTGLGLVRAAGNGHIWLTPAGWAFVLALEAAETPSISKETNNG